MGFKDGFLWGAAAASYQIEGAWNEEGKGLSVWDTFAQKEGTVLRGHSGREACDHYHRYREDVAVMKELGLKSYRFSVSWPRVLPEGSGRVNEKGLDFYSRLVDELLAADILPFLTLFHWDYPYELYCRGGWLNPDSSEWFAEYTAAVVDRLSDRVDHWFTLNEPQVFIGMGHSDGTHAPGLKLDRRDILRITHNTLLSHGKAVRTIRERAKKQPRIGFAPVCRVMSPMSESPADVEAVRKWMFSIDSLNGIEWSNSWLLDPVFFGRYPEDGVKLAGDLMPEIGADDMKTISQPLDFFGMNHYFGGIGRAAENGKAQAVKPETGEPLTAFRWRVVPEGLYWGPKFFSERYGKPIIVTENGLSNVDWIHLDGQVHDPQRIDFTRRYLREYRRAAEDGVDLEGYFHWSIMDNFEWAQGYQERFGMVYIDYPTQKRIIKDSGYWYREVIRSNGETL